MSRLSKPLMRLTRAVAACLALVLIAPASGLTDTNPQEQRNRALIEAVEHNDTPDALRLLDEGADANVRVGLPVSPGRHFIPDFDWQHTPTLLQRMLLNGIEAYVPQFATGGFASGITVVYQPLPENPAIVEALLAHGADPNALWDPPYTQMNGEGKRWTPLNLAAHRGYCRSMVLLLQHGANPNRKNGRGYNALLEAAAPFQTSRGYPSAEKVPSSSPCVLETLVQHGVDVNGRDTHRNTAAIVAVSAKFTEESIQTRLAMLLRYHANVNLANDKGETALSKSRARGFHRVEKMLLAAGAKH